MGADVDNNGWQRREYSPNRGRKGASSSSSSLGQSHPTAGKAWQPSHFAPLALSTEVMIYRYRQTDRHFIIIYIIIITITIIIITIIIIIIVVDENTKDFILTSGHRWCCDPLWGFRPRPPCPDHTQYVRYQFCSDSFLTSF